LDGRIHRINIYEPIDIVTQDVIDNQNNTEKEEKSGEKSPQRHLKHSDSQKSRKENTVSSHGHSNTTKLPEAQYKVIEDYVRPAKIKDRSNAYYRYIEKSVEELDDEVEYDMDEEVMTTFYVLKISKKYFIILMVMQMTKSDYILEFSFHSY